MQVPVQFKYKFFICHGHNNYREAVIGNEIMVLYSQVLICEFEVI